MKKLIFATTLFILAVPLTIEALTISPPLIELEIEPGDTAIERVKVINETDNPTELSVSIESFRAKGEEGYPEFISEEEQEEGLYDWIEINKEPFILGPRERKTMPLVIKVPEKASPGGYYAAIFWSTRPPLGEEGKAVIGVVSKIGSLILLRVKGEVMEKGSLREFSTPKTYYNYLPVNFVVRFENLGNVHLKPEGEIGIINIFKKIVDTLPVNKRRANVLPESIRKFETSWKIKGVDEKRVILAPEEGENFFGKFIREFKNEKNNFAFGKFLAQLNLNYGREGKFVQASIDFWVLPWRILSVSFLGIIGALFILICGLKKYNKWVVEKYQKRLMKEEEKRRVKEEKKRK